MPAKEGGLFGGRVVEHLGSADRRGRGLVEAIEIVADDECTIGTRFEVLDALEKRFFAETLNVN